MRSGLPAGHRVPAVRLQLCRSTLKVEVMRYMSITALSDCQKLQNFKKGFEGQAFVLQSRHRLLIEGQPAWGFCTEYLYSYSAAY